MKTNKYFKTFFINKKSQTSNPTSKKASIKQPIQRINQNKKTNQPTNPSPPSPQKKTNPLQSRSLASRPPLFGLVRWLGFLFLPDRVARFNRFRFVAACLNALPYLMMAMA